MALWHHGLISDIVKTFGCNWFDRSVGQKLVKWLVTWWFTISIQHMIYSDSSYSSFLDTDMSVWYVKNNIIWIYAICHMPRPICQITFAMRCDCRWAVKKTLAFCHTSCSKLTKQTNMRHASKNNYAAMPPLCHATISDLPDISQLNIDVFYSVRGEC